MPYCQSLAKHKFPSGDNSQLSNRNNPADVAWKAKHACKVFEWNETFRGKQCMYVKGKLIYNVKKRRKEWCNPKFTWVEAFIPKGGWERFSWRCHRFPFEWLPTYQTISKYVKISCATWNVTACVLYFFNHKQQCVSTCLRLCRAGPSWTAPASTFCVCWGVLCNLHQPVICKKKLPSSCTRQPNNLCCSWKVDWKRLCDQPE